MPGMTSVRTHFEQRLPVEELMMGEIPPERMIDVGRGFIADNRAASQFLPVYIHNLETVLLRLHRAAVAIGFDVVEVPGRTAA